ncbi:MAG TPA: response regulator [Verrucomicrobiae bacterium]|nr:response regulator [Verrucomicrobiae bacterium]
MIERGIILLAEDSQDDVLLIKRAFSRGGVQNPLYVVHNGEEVILYLKGEGKFSNRVEYPLPDLLLLDLKMPIVDGFGVLRWVRQQPNLAGLRVLVLTSSDSLRDVNLAYKLGANSFLVKPFEFENCVQLGKLIQDYWLEYNQPGEVSRPFSFPPPERATKPDPDSKL